MAGITWLHLSDWHQGSEAFVEYQKGEAYDRELLGKRLKRDILNRTSISVDLARIDFIVFSGDAAFSGQKAEYQSAIEQLFTPVLEAANLDKSRLFVVPGNHDLDRKKFQYLPAALTQPFSKDAEVKQWLKDSDREYVLKPFEDYEKFISSYTGQSSPTYASVANLEIDGKKVVLLGLNSALMCGRNEVQKNGKKEVDDYGKLVVGEPQLNDGLDQIGEADVRIAVIHHPFEWLMPFERMRIKEQLGQNFHFILCGHEHIPQVNMTQGTAGHCLIIPAGSGFDRRTSDDPSYTNAYNFVHLNFDTGEATVYLRRWNNRKSTWDKDTYVYDNGQISFELPQLRSHSMLEGEDHRGSPDPASNTGATKVQLPPQLTLSVVHPSVSPPPGPGPSLQQNEISRLTGDVIVTPASVFDSNIAVYDPPSGAARTDPMSFGAGELASPAKKESNLLISSDLSQERPEIGTARAETKHADPSETGLLSPIEQARVDVTAAQDYVKQADALFIAGKTVAPENLPKARSLLNKARKSISDLETILGSTNPSLPEPLASKKTGIIGQINIIDEQVDRLLESLKQGIHGDSKSLSDALNKIQELISE